MRMREIGFEGQPAIDAYGPGGFRVRGVWHAGALLVSRQGAAPVARPLDAAALGPLLALAAEIDVALIGQGAEVAPLAAPLRRLIEAAGIGLEVMATPPACRTYNVLLAEERRVAALLLPV